MKSEILKKYSRLWLEQFQNDIKLQYEQIKFTKDREFACLVPTDFKDSYMFGKSVRFLRCHSVQHLQYILSDLLTAGLQGTIYNLYHTLAKYKDGIPPISWGNMEKRKVVTRLWTDIHHKKIISYDWLIDFDVKDHTKTRDAYKGADKLHKLFNKIKLPHEIRFSGRGFHILVPYSVLKPLKLSFEPMGDNNIYDFLTDITMILYKDYSKLIDYDLFDSRRLIKLPFSAVHYNDGNYVCVPIDSEKRWEEFDFKKCTLDNIKYILGFKRYMFNEKSKTNIYDLLKKLNLEVD